MELSALKKKKREKEQNRHIFLYLQPGHYLSIQRSPSGCPTSGEGPTAVRLGEHLPDSAAYT